MSSSMSSLTRLNKWLARRIFDRLMRKVVAVRPPDFVIGNDPSNPYMRRWWVVLRNRFFNVYLHRILRDDEDRDALHDHPWASLSLCLSGEVGEIYKSSVGNQTRVAREGDWVYRGSRFAHALFLTSGPAWTLFMTGPRIREWGFWCAKNSPAGGWRPWQDYVSARDHGKVGAGCGEL